MKRDRGITEQVGRGACRLLIAWLAILLWAPTASAEGEELIGTPAPEFDIEQWVQSEPRTLSQLLGSVVLVRFWTDSCPLCSASGQVMARLHERYARDGLIVIGIYHPKPPGAVDPTTIERAAKTFGMEFPIGLDLNWNTLKRYWLGGGKRSLTSASFLIDRQGIIRFIHAGGSYSPEETEALEDAITRLLARIG